ncbi:MAG: tetratricopeptide repeat protein [Chloroflexi bacterium]|nr:tetratricopeptide repeat protein [Chloroflexota bacterium]
MADEYLQHAVAAAKSGNRPRAIDLIKQHIRQYPTDERGWWALARLTDDSKIKEQCLQRVLRLNPNHEKARALLQVINTSSDIGFRFEDDRQDSTPSPFDDAVDNSPEVESALGGSLFDDEPDVATAEPVFEPVRPADQSNLSPAASTANRQNASHLEWYIGIGLVLMAILAVPLLGYYAYYYQHLGLFGLFGPDLNAVARSDEFTIRYPDDWSSEVVDDNRTVVVATDNIERWSQVASQSLSIDNSTGVYDGDFGADAASVLSEETVIIVMSRVTSEDLQQLSRQTGAQYTSFQQYIDDVMAEAEANAGMELDQDGFEMKFDSDREEVKIDGDPGVFSFQTVYMKIPDEYTVFLGGLSEINYGVYYATVEHEGDEYLFMLVAIGDNADSHKRTARRMLRTVEFVH